ncbi:MAG: indole-3-glycerol phosphate synthase TrpC [Armatimonadetes bacterium]|nr:indole-3-glycerol phosphate synthase TrpC [Armatimonadota bacterium]
MTILDEIVAHKKEEVAAARRAEPPTALRARAESSPPPRDFAGALRGDRIRLIAEIKGASPSAGEIRAEIAPAALARAAAAGGASALSVLTDRRFFRGAPEHLAAARAAVALPVLRKDFTVDPYQVYEARAMGADAILLIAEILDRATMADLLALAAEAGLAALVEAHEPAQVQKALGAGARLVGINNRDLRTFSVDLGTTVRLRPLIPAECTVVSESGIETRADVAALEAAGVHAILVGTALMRSPDIAAKARELLGT